MGRPKKVEEKFVSKLDEIISHNDSEIVENTKLDISPRVAKDKLSENLEESRKELASLKLRMNFITKEEYQNCLENLIKINHNNIKMMEKI